MRDLSVQPFGHPSGTALLDIKEKSLIRGSPLLFAGVPIAAYLCGMEEVHATPLLILPVLLAVAGTADTARCMRKRWDFYHAGVPLLVYAGVMATCLFIFLLLYPYALWMSHT